LIVSPATYTSFQNKSKCLALCMNGGFWCNEEDLLCWWW
jgi:hypothetical protein